MQLAGLRAVVPGQLAQGPAVGRRAHDLEEGLDPMVSLPTIGKAEVIDLLADGEEIQAGFLAHQAQADPRVGPSVADGKGDAAVIGGQPPGGPSVAEELVEALPRPGPLLPADPTQVGIHHPADGGEPQGRCQGNPFLPAGGPEQGIPRAELAPDNRRIPARLLRPGSDGCQRRARALCRAMTVPRGWNAARR